MKILLIPLLCATLVACATSKPDGYPVSAQEVFVNDEDFKPMARAVIDTATIQKDRDGRMTAQVHFEDGDTKVISIIENGMVRFVRIDSE